METASWIERFLRTSGAMPRDIIRYVLVALVAVVLLHILYRAFVSLAGRRKKPTGPAEPGIRVEELGAEGPPEGEPALEYGGQPVRLAAVILAPAGRLSEVPPDDEREGLYDSLLPGLAATVRKHDPLILVWPPQISAKGFTVKVFRACPLPGDNGKDSPWCIVAGPLKAEGRPFVAGLILCAARPTSHTQRALEDPDEWMACLSVKGG